MTHTSTPTVTNSPTPTPTVECASGVLIARARMRVSKNADPAGDERLTLQGEVTLAPAIDPVANGFRFKVADTNGVPLYSFVVPPGLLPGPGVAGWTVNRSLTKWTYKNGTPIGRVTITDRSSQTPGLYKFKVTGKDGDFQVKALEVPVQLVVVLGPGAGQCATRAFNPAGGSAPTCELKSGGNALSCN